MKDFILLFLVAVSAADYIKRKSGSECESSDYKLGKFSTVEECADACRQKDGCKFFIYGTGSKSGYCYWEYTKTADCSEGWETDKYNFYEVAGCPAKFATADELYCNGSWR